MTNDSTSEPLDGIGTQRGGASARPLSLSSSSSSSLSSSSSSSCSIVDGRDHGRGCSAHVAALSEAFHHCPSHDDVDDDDDDDDGGSGSDSGGVAAATAVAVAVAMGVDKNDEEEGPQPSLTVAGTRRSRSILKDETRIGEPARVDDDDDDDDTRRGIGSGGDNGDHDQNGEEEEAASAHSPCPTRKRKKENTRRDSDENDAGLVHKKTKIILAFLLFVLVVYAIVDSIKSAESGGMRVRAITRAFLGWAERHPVGGCFAFVAVFGLATVLFVPGLILTLGAGFIFSNAYGMSRGIAVGTASVFFGAYLGSVASFMLGRYIYRDWAKRLTEKFPMFKAIDQALETKGLRIMMLLRLSPIVPFNVLNYVCGVSSVTLLHFVLALFAMLPGTALYVVVGSTAMTLSHIGSNSSSSALTVSSLAVGIVLGVVAIVLSSWYAKKELNKLLAERRQSEREDEGRGTLDSLTSTTMVTTAATLVTAV